MRAHNQSRPLLVAAADSTMASQPSGSNCKRSRVSLTVDMDHDGSTSKRRKGTIYGLRTYIAVMVASE